MKKRRAGWMRAAVCALLCCMLAGCSYRDIFTGVPGNDASIVDNYGRLPEQLAQESGRSSGSLSTRGQEAEESFLMKEAGAYSQRALSEAEMVWYHDMEEILGSFGEKIALSGSGLQAGLTEESIDKIFQCVLNDHPELFYVDGYSYVKYSRGDVLTAVEFSGTYNVDRETARQRREEIEAQAQAILAGIDMGASDYEKVKYVYDTLITSTDYELQAPDNQNIYSVFVNHRSVCQGYAKATQYLLNRMGVECTLVLGTVEKGEGHAWNLVKVDGSYYYVDTTWGDASYQVGDADTAVGASMPEINYDYLNVTTEEILRTHSIGGSVPMPVCVDTEANYYVREGAWFSSCDREQLQALFDGVSDSGKRDVAIKCADDFCYDQVVKSLIEDQEIFELWEGAGSSIAYAQNEKQLSLTFWVTNGQ